MKLDVWKIDGRSFHFGRHGLGQEQTSIHFPSDSLFAALVSRMSVFQEDDDISKFGDLFLKGDPPFALTSAYPRAGNVLFFPPPLVKKVSEKEDAFGNDKAIDPKDLKKVQYVSEELFRLMIDGKSLAEIWNDAVTIQAGKALVSTTEFETLPDGIRSGVEDIWKVTRRPRVTVERVTQTSLIYHTGLVTYNADCGLWFGVQWLKNDSSIDSSIKDLFQELGDAGLGGERSSGFGAAMISQGSGIEFSNVAGDNWVTLSRFIPAETQIDCFDGKQVAYDIEPVGGWVAASNAKDQRRRSVHMVVEGSVLSNAPGSSPGMMVEVDPRYPTPADLQLGHPVWRNGYAVAVSVKV